MAPRGPERLGFAKKGSTVARFSSQELKRVAARWKGLRDPLTPSRFPACRLSDDGAPSVALAVFHHWRNDISGPVSTSPSRFAEAPLKGLWFNRTEEHAAGNRGEDFGHFKYTEEEELALSAVPFGHAVQQIERVRRCPGGIVWHFLPPTWPPRSKICRPPSSSDSGPRRPTRASTPHLPTSLEITENSSDLHYLILKSTMWRLHCPEA